MYDILWFLNFSILTANNTIEFFHLNLLLIANILTLFYHSFHIHWEKINFYNLTSFYLLTYDQ